MYIQIKLKDFTSKADYYKLQKQFLMYDDDYDATKLSTPEEPTQTKLDINYTINDEFGFVTRQVLNFETDLLEAQIPLFHDKYFKIFVSEARKEYTQDAKNGLSRQRINDILEIKEAIETASYLKHSIKILIIEELEKLEDSIAEYQQNPFPKIKYKLEFNLNNSEVILLFHLMREKKLINHIEDRDLGKILDNFCKCLSSNSEAYNNLRRSRKLLNNFKNGSRPNEMPLRRLNKKFQELNFPL